MPSISQNIELLRQLLPAGVKLVAVSKFHPVEAVIEAYGAGQRLFGENHAQELVAKAPSVPADLQWHFIGHLQTNKVRMIMPHVAMIQSIDTEKLLKVVNKEAARIGRTVDVLLQLHVAQETTKTGFSIDELRAFLDTGILATMPNVKARGLMAMATNTDNQAQVRREFTLVRRTFEQVRRDYFDNDAAQFTEVSMGMSHDWRIAVDCGSTMVRVGTAIFGPRQY